MANVGEVRHYWTQRPNRKGKETMKFRMEMSSGITYFSQ